MSNIDPVVTGSGDPYRARYMTVKKIAQVLQGGVSMVQYQTEDGRVLWLPKDQWDNLFVPVMTTHMVMDVGVS